MIRPPIFRDKFLHRVIYARKYAHAITSNRRALDWLPKKCNESLDLQMLLLHNRISSLLYPIASSAKHVPVHMRLCMHCVLHVCIFACAIEYWQCSTDFSEAGKFRTTRALNGLACNISLLLLPEIS